MIFRLFAESFSIQKVNYGVAIIAMIIIAIMTALTAWIMRDIIDSMTASEDKTRVFSVAIAVALIFSVKGIATYVQVVWLSKAGNSIVAFQQRKLYAKILEHGVSFFSEKGSSNILTQVTRSAQAARRVINTLVMGFVRDLLTLIGLLFVMFYQQPTLSLFSLILGPIAILGIRRILFHVRKIMEAETLSMAEIIRVVQETSFGIRVVKAFALEDRMAARMEGAIGSVENRANAISRLEAATSPLVDTLSGFAIAGVVALSTTSIFGNSETSPGALMSFITALLMAYEPAKRLARMRVTIEAGMIRVGAMYEILDAPISVEESQNAVSLPKGSGQVTFKDVCFTYGDKDQLIHDMNLTFKAGITTALVGPSGGGKSTIINLLLRFYDPVSGSILIDDCDIKDAKFASLREHVAFVGQDTFLFGGTLKQNIALGSDGTTEEDIIAAAKAANAHEFIEGMPKKYDTNVGENGGNLSGGQRQRIAIARAMLRNSPILVLDEATSALDPESEYLVNAALKKLSKGRTTIIIAHRLSTIQSADQILVINKGKVVEEGTQSELLSKGGLFQTLYGTDLSISNQ